MRKTIANHALLVSLNVGKPQMTKTDSQATGIVKNALNAEKESGHFRKEMYPKRLVEPINSVERAARKYMQTVAYPWNRGELILPSPRFMVFAEEMAKYELGFDQGVTAFQQNWVNVQTEAKAIQGDMYDAQDYPDVTEIRRRFRFEVSYRPITDVGDFRLHLQDEEFSLLKAKVSEQAQSNIEELMAEPLRRLRDVVSRLHDTAGKGERAVLNPRTGKTEVKPPIFRDTVCENIIHEINLLSDFAAIMPENIVQLANDAAAKIPSADMLRNSQAVRNKTVENTAGLLDAINLLLEE